METITFEVRGMSCGGCEERIAAVLRRVEGVREVTADHATGQVQVRAGAELSDRQVLVERIDAAGFAVVKEVVS